MFGETIVYVLKINQTHIPKTTLVVRKGKKTTVIFVNKKVGG